MAEVTTQPDGSAQITVTASDAAALKAMAEVHLPFLQRVLGWLSRDVAPEVGEAVDFLKTLSASQDSTLTVSAPQVQALRGLLNAHVPDFQAVLAVVESPAVRSLLTLAKDLL